VWRPVVGYLSSRCLQACRPSQTLPINCNHRQLNAAHSCGQRSQSVLRPVLSCASLELAQGEQTCININSCSATTPTLLCFLLSCRQLYPLLTDYSSYVGVWHQSGEAASPAGALFSFRWAPNGIEVVQLQPRRQFTTDIAHQRLCMLGPGYPRFQGDLVVGGTKCVLRDYGSSREQHSNGGGSPAGKSSATEVERNCGGWHCSGTFLNDHSEQIAEIWCKVSVTELVFTWVRVCVKFAVFVWEYGCCWSLT
jgi:hypothetical protein